MITYRARQPDGHKQQADTRRQIYRETDLQNKTEYWMSKVVITKHHLAVICWNFNLLIRAVMAERPGTAFRHLWSLKNN